MKLGTHLHMDKAGPHGAIGSAFDLAPEVPGSCQLLEKVCALSTG